jgi:hypothetical protein
MNNLPQVDTQYVTGNKTLYRVHCLTFGMAKEIFGYSRECNLATPMNHTLMTFRAYPKYRRPGAKALRAEVCSALKFNRAGERIGRKVQP